MYKQDNLIKKGEDTMVDRGQLGRQIAAQLFLKKDKDGYYRTQWGRKSDVGLYAVVEAVFNRNGIVLREKLN